jgi:mannose-1-phosphate guanylyltransferase / phosphomannomutase
LTAHRDILDSKVKVELSGFPLRPGVYIGEGTEIDPAAKVEGPAVIGDNCRIGVGTRIGPYCVLAANARIGDSSDLERTVIHDNCYLGAGVVARGSVVGRLSDLRQGVHLEEGVVLGDECLVGRAAMLGAGVKVYPHKTVEAGAIVNSSIVWESRGSRSLFGPLGVSGLANVDISPELGIRVALAFATTLPKGSTVTTSRDSSRAARALKRAAMVGINSAGCNVEDLEVATVPLTRFHVRTGSSAGGLTVRLAPGDPDAVVLRFLDADGVDLDEAAQRKIERLYYREETRRVLAAEIGDIDFPPRTLELYTLELVAGVNLETIRRARFKLVLDYAYGTASYVMPTVLSKLGAEVLAVNPHVSTIGAMGFDRELHASRLGDLVRSSGAHLGAVIDPDGEQLTIVDDTGRVLTHAEALLALIRLVGSTTVGARIVVPVSASREVERLCAELGARLSWAKLGASSLNDVVSSGRVDFAGNACGGYSFPEFLPAYDSVATLVHLLDLLAQTGAKISAVAAGLPAPHVAHVEVPTPPEQKGGVMRAVVERAEGGEVVLIDGVKAFDADGWTLIVPDPELPLTHVYAEADDASGSEKRARRAATEIEALIS